MEHQQLLKECEDEYNQFKALAKLDDAAGLKDLKQEEFLYLQTHQGKMNRRRSSKYEIMLEAQVAQMKTMFEQLMNTYAQQNLANWSLPELLQFKNFLESKSGWRDKYPDILGIRISENELPFEVCVDDVVNSAGLNGFNCDNERYFANKDHVVGSPREATKCTFRRECARLATKEQSPTKFLNLTKCLNYSHRMSWT